MAGKKQEIRIVVHMTEQGTLVFHKEQVEEFWIEKISSSIQKSRLTKQEQQCLLQKMQLWGNL